MFRRLLAALAAALFSVSVFDAAHAGARGQACAGPGYTYAGVAGDVTASGVAATVTMLSPPQVRTGHVGAWVGVGGRGLGANGTDAWIQTGLSAFADGRTEVYYEIAVGTSVSYVRVKAVAPAERHRLAVPWPGGRNTPPPEDAVTAVQATSCSLLLQLPAPTIRIELTCVPTHARTRGGFDDRNQVTGS